MTRTELSGLKKHLETENHIEITLGIQLMMSDKLDNQVEIRKFIEGFN